MQINQLAKDHIEFCQSKGLPVEKIDLIFLIERIQKEAQEAREAHREGNMEHVQEELVDVLLQTIQALAVIDPDLESAIKKKIIINRDRTWE